MKTKRNYVWLWIAILLVAALLSAAFVRHCCIGDARCADVRIETLEVTDTGIHITGDADGFCAFKEYRYELGEDTLTVTMTYTWPLIYTDSGFDIQLAGDFSHVSEIDIADGRNARVVWEREQG